MKRIVAEKERRDQTLVGAVIRRALLSHTDAAQMLADALRTEPTLSRVCSIRMQMRIVSEVLRSITREGVNPRHTERLLERTRYMPFCEAMRLANRHPQQAGQVFASLVYEEMTKHHGWDRDQILGFISKFVCATGEQMSAAQGDNRRGRT